MDQTQAPLLDGIAAYRKQGRYGFTPPGHRQGRGVDQRVLATLGDQPFADDILASGGLDDRLSRNQYLSHAEQLMAAAVAADGATRLSPDGCRPRAGRSGACAYPRTRGSGGDGA